MVKESKGSCSHKTSQLPAGVMQRHHKNQPGLTHWLIRDEGKFDKEPILIAVHVMACRSSSFNNFIVVPVSSVLGPATVDETSYICACLFKSSTDLLGTLDKQRFSLVA